MNKSGWRIRNSKVRKLFVITISRVNVCGLLELSGQAKNKEESILTNLWIFSLETCFPEIRDLLSVF